MTQTTLGSSYKSPATCLDAKLVPSDWDIWDLNWTQHCCNTATSKLPETIWNAHLFLQSESDIASTCMFTTSWKEANTSQHPKKIHRLCASSVSMLCRVYKKNRSLIYTNIPLQNCWPRTAASILDPTDRYVFCVMISLCFASGFKKWHPTLAEELHAPQ